MKLSPDWKTRTHYSLSGVKMENICDRDLMWCAWLDDNGASDASINEFLRQFPSEQEEQEC